MKLFRVAICLALLAAAVGFVPVNADTHFLYGPLAGAITVLPLSGGVSNTANLKVRGDGFQLLAGNTDSGAVDALIACMPCAPGDEVDLSALFANDDLGEGVVTIGRDRLKAAFLAGHLTIRAGTVRVPDRGRRRVTLSAPFTLEDGGELQVYTSDFARFSRDSEDMWAQGPITGSGRATIVLTRLDLPDQVAYVVEKIRYSFDALSAPDPDLPVRTGLLGLTEPNGRVTGH